MKNLLKILFGQEENKLSKFEYWKKWKFIELLNELKKAEKILSAYRGGISINFGSAEEFHVALIDEIDNIEEGNKNDLSQIWEWFAPTCDWDDIVGEEGESIGNRIFEIANKWHKIEGHQKTEN